MFFSRFRRSFFFSRIPFVVSLVSVVFLRSQQHPIECANSSTVHSEAVSTHRERSGLKLWILSLFTFTTSTQSVRPTTGRLATDVCMRCIAHEIYLWTIIILLLCDFVEMSCEDTARPALTQRNKYEKKSIYKDRDSLHLCTTREREKKKNKKKSQKRENADDAYQTRNVNTMVHVLDTIPEAYSIPVRLDKIRPCTECKDHDRSHDAYADAGLAITTVADAHYFRSPIEVAAACPLTDCCHHPHHHHYCYLIR